MSQLLFHWQFQVQADETRSVQVDWAEMPTLVKEFDPLYVAYIPIQWFTHVQGAMYTQKSVPKDPNTL